MKFKLTFIYCLFVLILSVLPGKSFPKVEITNADKIVHFLMYFLMIGVMFFDDFLFHAKSAKVCRKERKVLKINVKNFALFVVSLRLCVKKCVKQKQLLCFFFFAVIFGAIIEVIQYFLPSRSAEWYDLLSNSAGAFLGIIVIFILKKSFLSKKI